MPKITIQDVARAAGTSVSTVSRVLTGSSPVSPDKREAVEAAIEQLGFSPSQVARSLRTRATQQTISLLINDITNPFYSAVAKGVEEEANRLGYSLILCNTNDDPSRERQYLSVLRTKQVDGIIFGPTGGNIDLIDDLMARIPLVFVDRVLEEVTATAIVADNEGGGYSAASLLIEQGHTQIGVITKRAEISTLAERLSGARRAFRDARMDFDPALLIQIAHSQPKQIAVEISRWLQDHADQRPTALFALNNQLGVGTLRALRELEMHIPEDIALIVFDDLDVFELTDPPISVVAQPAVAMGRRAMQALARRIERATESTPTIIMMPTELILRGSV